MNAEINWNNINAVTETNHDEVKEMEYTTLRQQNESLTWQHTNIELI